jgi:hypothetical protein
MEELAQHEEIFVKLFGECFVRLSCHFFPRSHKLRLVMLHQMRFLGCKAVVKIFFDLAA